MASDRQPHDRREGWGPHCAQHEDQVERVCDLSGTIDRLAEVVTADSKELVRVTASLGTWARAVAVLQVVALFVAGGVWTDYREARRKSHEQLEQQKERWQQAQLLLKELETGRKENRALIDLILRSHKIEEQP